MIKIIDPKYPIIEPEDFGRRPTSKYDISGILFLMQSSKKDFVEIGSWYGKTTYEIAIRFPNKLIYSMDYIGEDLILDPASNRALIKDKEDLCSYARGIKNVGFIYANSHTFDFNKFQDVDFFFIDGDHSFEGVKTDSEKAMIYLKKNGGGTIAWHDVHTKNLTQVPDYMQSIAKTKNIFYLKNTNIGFITI